MVVNIGGNCNWTLFLQLPSAQVWTNTKYTLRQMPFESWHDVPSGMFVPFTSQYTFANPAIESCIGRPNDFSQIGFCFYDIVTLSYNSVSIPLAESRYFWLNTSQKCQSRLFGRCRNLEKGLVTDSWNINLCLKL